VSRYFWYYAPLVPGIIACVGLGAASVVLIAQYTTRFVLRHYQDIFRSTHMKTTALVLTFILIAVLAVFQVKDLNRIRQHVDSRIHIYRAVGEWLQSNTNVDAKIGTLEVFQRTRPMKTQQYGLQRNFNLHTWSYKKEPFQN
jgi:hypothetical protein